jgi:hypothetical protein
LRLVSFSFPSGLAEFKMDDVARVARNIRLRIVLYFMLGCILGMFPLDLSGECKILVPCT